MLTKFKKKKKRGKYKDMVFPVFMIIVFVTLIVVLVTANVKITKKRARLTSQINILKQEIQTLEQRNKDLGAGLSQSGSEEHLEKVAREQLDLKKPGEEVVVIAKEQDQEKEQEEPEEKKNSWNPKYWWEWIRNR